MSSNYFKQVLLASEADRLAARRVVDEVLGGGPVPVEDEVRDKQVLIRVSESQREQWQAAAEADGLSVSEWLRQMADDRWSVIYTCVHPLDQRRSYPWSEFCLKCGVRIR